jgi:hypothetical protein
MVGNTRQEFRGRAGSLGKSNHGTDVFSSKYFVHHRANEMHVFVPDLHEDRAGLGQQIARDGEAVAQIREIRVNP